MDVGHGAEEPPILKKRSKSQLRKKEMEPIFPTEGGGTAREEEEII